MERSGTDVQVFIKALGELGSEAVARSALTVEELNRSHRFTFASDRLRHILARAFLRRVLALRLGTAPQSVSLEPGRHGKPMLPSRYGLNFNLSHSGDIVALAVARMPVGIDVERERQDVDCHALAQGLFTGRERAIVGTGADAQARRAFFAIWTRKEAYAKGTGQGLSVPLAELDTGEAPFAPAPYSILRDSADPTWFATPLPCPPGYVACLATPCERPCVVMCDQ